MLSLLAALRRSLALLDFAAFTLLVFVLALLPWPGRNRHPVSGLFHSWCRAFVRALDVELRLHQKNLHPLPGHYILIANHPSAFEDIGIPALFPVVSLAKLQVKDWFVVGRIARAAGTLFVDRDDPASRQQSVETMVAAVKGGQNIALYPEGGCKGRRLFSEFKSGAFEVSMRTGVPVIPVFLHYEAQDDFEWQPPWTLPQMLWRIGTSRNRRAHYYVFDPLDPKDFADKYAMKAAAYERYARWDKAYLQ